MRSLVLAAIALTLAGGPAAAMSSAPITPPPPRPNPFFEGQRAVKAKDYKLAVPYLERALEEYPRNAETLNLLGYSHRQLGETFRAFGYYLRALEIDPNHRGANEYLGELYVEINDLPKAEERLQKLAQICGTVCEEYRDLKAAIDKAKAGAAPRAGS